MPLPELSRRTAEKLFTRYCEEHRSSGDCDPSRLFYRIQDDHITLFAERPPASGTDEGTASPVARFRFSHELGQWSLHYPDRQGRWHLYLNVGPSLDLERLLRHLDADPLHLFWD